jgi:glycosyltransferase involved in cell wall biosynthesis
MRAVRAESPILWTFLPTQITLDLVREVRPRLLVYYCTDNFAATSREARRVVGTEREILRRADVVFAMSRAMVEHCRQSHDGVIQLTMGVNVERFEKVREGPLNWPDDLRGCRPPIIGYVGGVRPTIDRELIKQLARQRPDCTIVFVGPLQMPVSELRVYPNIVFLGPKPHDEIPRYVRAFDCCILPYVKSALTDSVSPAKFHEYLIMGKPVVSTNIAEVAPFAEDPRPHPLVYVARDAPEFLRCIDRALAEPDGQAEGRIAAARLNGWDRKLETIATVIEARLHAKARSP